MIFRHTGMAVKSTVFGIFCLCALLLAGCSSVPKTPARLYDLDNGQVVKIELYHLRNGHGRVTGIMPDGKVLEGKYALNSPPLQTSGNNDTRSNAGQATADTIWAIRYGYTRGSQQPPIGSGSVTDKSGYTMHFVLYSIDTATGYGTGLGEDSNGAWYRLHVGKQD